MSQEYLQGDDFSQYVNRRKKRGLMWQTFFQLSTLVGIIALLTLLYNIINSAFGFVAIENKIDPTGLVIEAEKTRLLNAPNSTASEDDTELGEGVAANPYAVGFFGHAFYANNRDRLKVLSIDGISPSAATVSDGTYPLTRPLLIYSSVRLMERKDRLRGFINYYISEVNNQIEEVGYFPAQADVLAQAEDNWLTANGFSADDVLPAVDAASLDGRIVVVGSSTVYPLTDHMANNFLEAGFDGRFDMESIDTGAGFEQFCVNRAADLVNASRAMNAAELAACEAGERVPVEFQVGMDATVVAVSSENTFLDSVTEEELRQIFTGATLWSDVNSEWPAEPIERFVPTASSGTLDIFADHILDAPLDTLPAESLITILENNLSAGLVRRLDSEGPLAERTQEELYSLVLARVVEPSVSESWALQDSIFNKAAIEARVADRYPDATLEFRSWLTTDFVANPQSSQPELAGVRTAVFGSLWVILITILVSFPLGVGAAIYLEEYASTIEHPTVRRVNEVIQTNINNLAGVPSIIYGILGLVIFVRLLEPFTSGAFFGVIDDETTANGRTIISAGATLALLILPLIIINSQEAIRAVSNSIRQASYGLGATRWQTIWNHVLPSALPGILTGTILAISRAVGETAPLVVIGASTFITVDPTNPFSKFTVLPIQIFQWTSRPQAEFRNIAAAAIIVLLILLLSLNASAVLLRNRYSRSI